METRIALIGIIVENPDSVEELNHLLHEYGHYIIGRMGIPFRERNLNIISVAIDAPQDIISALSGKIGRLNGIGVKTVYSNITGNNSTNSLRDDPGDQMQAGYQHRTAGISAYNGEQRLSGNAS